MDADTVTQLVTTLAAVLAIVWHQQRSTDRLRREAREDNRELRKDFEKANKELRSDHAKLNDAVAENGQRLARIEGFLRIGIPPAAEPPAPDAPGPSNPD